MSLNDPHPRLQAPPASPLLSLNGVGGFVRYPTLCDAARGRSLLGTLVTLNLLLLENLTGLRSAVKIVSRDPPIPIR